MNLIIITELSLPHFLVSLSLTVYTIAAAHHFQPALLASNDDAYAHN